MEKRKGTVGHPLCFAPDEYFAPGDERCVCSLCGEPIMKADEYCDHDGSHFDPEFDPPHNFQRFHLKPCFEKITDLKCKIGEILMERDRELGRY